MNVRKIVLSIFIFISLGLIVSSCEKTEIPKEYTAVGEWTTVERRFSSNNTFITQSVNGLIKEDNKTYEIKRYFEESGYNIGSIETTAVNKETGRSQRKRDATYKIVGDSIYIDDEKFEQGIAHISVSEKTMTTYQKITKKELDYIVTELGGDPNLIPNDIQGVYKMVEKR